MSEGVILWKTRWQSKSCWTENEMVKDVQEDLKRLGARGWRRRALDEDWLKNDAEQVRVWLGLYHQPVYNNRNW